MSKISPTNGIVPTAASIATLNTIFKNTTLAIPMRAASPRMQLGNKIPAVSPMEE
jgi:hypothetical protein